MLEYFKLVTIGDGAVGKTRYFILLINCNKSYKQLLSSCWIALLEGDFPVEYVPTVLDNTETLIISNDLVAGTGFWDTGGEEGYARIRTLSYPNTDLFVLMFSVVNKPSFTNVKDRWLVEVRHHCPKTPILLVGTKSDLRGKQGFEWEVSREQVDDIVSELNLAGYVECSAKDGTGLRRVIDEAIRIVTEAAITPYINGGKKKKKDCSIM